MSDHGRQYHYHLSDRRCRLFFDPNKAESAAVVSELARYESDDPRVIVVVGGDGTMLRAIRHHWQERLPFFGLNTGHIGFLLNDRSRVDFWDHELTLYRLPLLAVGMVGTDGVRHSELAFNDCWVERDGGQTAWLEVSVNGVVRLPRLVADGLLVATAAGSTGYARAMGATPLPFNAPLITLAGSNVLKPEMWHPAVLTPDCIVRVRNLDPDKRPLRGFVDGVPVGSVTEMTALISPQAAVELLFTEEHDPVAKLALLQFPQPG
jgi:NAD kinase